MIVTNITPIDKKKSVVSVEHGAAFPLYNGEIRRFGIENGAPLSEEILGEIYEVLKKRVKERSLYLLRSMDRTEYEIRNKLKKGCYPEEMIEYAVNFLKKYGYIDDRRYAENYISASAGKKSRKIIRQSLYLKGISKEVAEETLQMFQGSGKEEEERSLIYSLIKKKRYDYENADRKEKNRIAAFLLRKGFEMEDVMYCLRNCPEEYQEM